MAHGNVAFDTIDCMMSALDERKLSVKWKFFRHEPANQPSNERVSKSRMLARDVVAFQFLIVQNIFNGDEWKSTIWTAPTNECWIRICWKREYITHRPKQQFTVYGELVPLRILQLFIFFSLFLFASQIYFTLSCSFRLIATIVDELPKKLQKWVMSVSNQVWKWTRNNL